MRGRPGSYRKERSRASSIHFPTNGASLNRKSRSRISWSFSRRSWRASSLIRDCTAFALVACARNRLMKASASFRFRSSFTRVCSWIISSWRIWPYSFSVLPGSFRTRQRWIAIVWVVTLSMKSRSCVISISDPFQAHRNRRSQRIETMSR